MEFKSIDEYYKEFINLGKESFYDFLEEKLQEAQKSGNQELVNHIEYLQMDVANQEFYEKETKRIEDEERRNWTDYNYGEASKEVSIDSDNTEFIEESTPVQPENENKEALLDELSNVKYYLSELENKMNVEDFHAQYESFEIDDMWRKRHAYEERIEQIETLLAKEMKSKSARDAGFEVNEFGEKIRTSKPLGEISTEDLSKLEEKLNQEIDANSEKIKQAQIDRLLAKQKIIRKQRETLKELEGQAIDFDD